MEFALVTLGDHLADPHTGTWSTQTEPADASRAIFAEYADLLMRLLRDDKVTWRGTWRSPLDDVSVEPRSVPRPHLPVWIAGGSSAASVDLAADLGARLMLPGVFAPAPFFRTFAEPYRERFAATGLDVVDDIIRLPLFDEDLEVDGLPAEVVAMHERIAAADGVAIATPEYNFGVPGPLKNWLDWASRPERRSPLSGKPVLLMGASTGLTGGTVQSQGQLRVSLAVLGAHVVPWPPVLLAGAAGDDKFDDGGRLVDQLAQTVIGMALDRFLALIDSLAPPGGCPA